LVTGWEINLEKSSLLAKSRGCFSKHHVERSQQFFNQHGGKAIILARFIPIIRTFTPILAGIGDMPYKTFVTYNLMGGVLWGCGVTLAGYLLGNSIPNIDHYLTYIVIVIVALSLIPILKHTVGSKK
jgi:membrane-associated protein